MARIVFTPFNCIDGDERNSSEETNGAKNGKYVNSKSNYKGIKNHKL
jgi:hypothetical protein